MSTLHFRDTLQCSQGATKLVWLFAIEMVALDRRRLAGGEMRDEMRTDLCQIIPAIKLFEAIDKDKSNLMTDSRKVPLLSQELGGRRRCSRHVYINLLS